MQAGPVGEQRALGRLHVGLHRRKPRRHHPCPRAGRAEEGGDREQLPAAHHGGEFDRDEDHLRRGLDERLEKSDRVDAVCVEVSHAALHTLVTTRHRLDRCECGGQGARLLVPLVQRSRQVLAHGERGVGGGKLLECVEDRGRHSVQRIRELPPVERRPVLL